MSRRPSNAEHRKRLRDQTVVGYADYRWAVDNVRCPVCRVPRYVACGRDLTYSSCKLHTARLLLASLIPKGESLLEVEESQTEVEKYWRMHVQPAPRLRAFDPNEKIYPKR